MVAFTCPDQEGAVAAVIVHEDALGLPASEVPVVPAAGWQAQQGACTLQYTAILGTNTHYTVLVCVWLVDTHRSPTATSILNANCTQFQINLGLGLKDWFHIIDS